MTNADEMRDEIEYKQCKEIANRIFGVLSNDEGHLVIFACMLVIKTVLTDAPKEHFPTALTRFISSLKPMLDSVEKERDATQH
jgi:hypothetical protein